MHRYTGFPFPNHPHQEDLVASRKAGVITGSVIVAAVVALIARMRGNKTQN